MRTPDEIKKGLGCCCINGQDCSACPYQCNITCIDVAMRDALAYIQQLETRLAQAEQAKKHRGGNQMILYDLEKKIDTEQEVTLCVLGSKTDEVVFKISGDWGSVIWLAGKTAGDLEVSEVGIRNDSLWLWAEGSDEP